VELRDKIYFLAHAGTGGRRCRRGSRRARAASSQLPSPRRRPSGRACWSCWRTPGSTRTRPERRARLNWRPARPACPACPACLRQTRPARRRRALSRIRWGHVLRHSSAAEIFSEATCILSAGSGLQGPAVSCALHMLAQGRLSGHWVICCWCEAKGVIIVFAMCTGALPVQHQRGLRRWRSRTAAAAAAVRASSCQPSGERSVPSRAHAGKLCTSQLKIL
jgi:hypothetical protein